MNPLYYGDNPDALRASIADETVDLVYLDPRASMSKMEGDTAGSKSLRLSNCSTGPKQQFRSSIPERHSEKQNGNLRTSKECSTFEPATPI